MAPKKKKGPQNQSVTISADPNEDYITWLSLVPSVERKRMAKMVSEHPLDTFSDLATLTKKITAEVLAGTLSPTVATIILDFIQTLFTCVGAAAAQAPKMIGGSSELDALGVIAESSQQIQDTVIDFATVDVSPSIFNT